MKGKVSKAQQIAKLVAAHDPWLRGDLFIEVAFELKKKSQYLTAKAFREMADKYGWSPIEAGRDLLERQGE